MITLTDYLQAAGVLVAVLAIAREANSGRIERKRAQPIVIAHPRDLPTFASGSNPGWVASASLTNEGGGNAFNVRFGIELRGVPFPFRDDGDDPPAGTCERDIRMGGETQIQSIRVARHVQHRVAQTRRQAARIGHVLGAV